MRPEGAVLGIFFQKLAYSFLRCIRLFSIRVQHNFMSNFSASAPSLSKLLKLGQIWVLRVLSGVLVTAKAACDEENDKKY
jgi:hypothetical protein